MTDLAVPGQPITAFLISLCSLCLRPFICWRFVLQLFLPINVMLMCPLMKPRTYTVPVGGQELRSSSLHNAFSPADGHLKTFSYCVGNHRNHKLNTPFRSGSLDSSFYLRGKTRKHNKQKTKTGLCQIYSVITYVNRDVRSKFYPLCCITVKLLPLPNSAMLPFPDCVLWECYTP